MSEVFHEGELAIQRKAGVAVATKSFERQISNSIVRGAISFIENQAMAIISSVDLQKKIWVSVLFGDFGFVKVPDPNSLFIDLTNVYSDKSDIVYSNIENESQLGTLFIELATRRRFRINGIAQKTGDQIDLSVVESYANCPKYIQQRIIHNPTKINDSNAKKSTGQKFDDRISTWISSADTLFVGTQSLNGKMDASHRGGKPGFVEVISGDTIKIPDYQGNNLFNTFGNLEQNPNTGLLFIDFENNTSLQLTGRTTLLFDQKSEDDDLKTTGTGRYWVFKVSDWIITENQHQADWEFTGFSPFNP